MPSSFAGNTTTEIRGERFRRFITEGNLADRHLGTLGGRAYTVGQYWERLIDLLLRHLSYRVNGGRWRRLTL